LALASIYVGATRTEAAIRFQNGSFAVDIAASASKQELGE